MSYLLTCRKHKFNGSHVVVGRPSVHGTKGNGRRDHSNVDEEAHGDGLLVEVSHFLDPIGTDSPLKVANDALTPPLWLSCVVSGDGDGFRLVVKLFLDAVRHSIHGLHLLVDVS